jgi:adenine-specific DNA-methyltransferase
MKMILLTLKLMLNGFTYILGKNESCKTAANRFWELSAHKDKATIKDVENAFLS